MGKTSAKVEFVATGTIELAHVWSEIRGGRYAFSSATSSGETYYLSLRRCVPRRNYSRASLDELEAVLTRGSRAVALATGLALSTLALRAAATLRELKVLTKPSSVPLVLGLAIAAHRKDLRLSVDLQKKPQEIAVRYSVYPGLKDLLSSSEFTIAMALLAGDSYADIARERDVSLRTVTNQGAAAFRRLGLSSRTELIQWLAVQGAARATASTPVPPDDEGVTTTGALRAEIEALKKRVAMLERDLVRAGTRKKKEAE
jgi:DNA-binding CsgD family transcriptional regulator